MPFFCLNAIFCLKAMSAILALASESYNGNPSNITRENRLARYSTSPQNSYDEVIFFRLRFFRLTARIARFFLAQLTKVGKCVPNDHKVYRRPLNIPNFHSKAFKGTSHLVFLAYKYVYHLATLVTTAVLLFSGRPNRVKNPDFRPRTWTRSRVLPSRSN
jgi:hypothetical protein